MLKALTKYSTCTLLTLAFTLAGFVNAETLKAPALTNTNGQPFAAEAYADQPLLINFWATWCAPCRIEMPDLDELQSHYDTERFTVLGIAADEMSAVTEYLQAVPVNYPIYVGDTDQVFAWSAQLGNRALGIPFSALIDHSGSVRWVKIGGRISVDEMVPLIDRLLEERTTEEQRP